MTAEWQLEPDLRLKLERIIKNLTIIILHDFTDEIKFLIVF